MQLFTMVLCSALFKICIAATFMSPEILSHELFMTEKKLKTKQISKTDVMFMDNIFEDADSTNFKTHSNIRSKKYSINKMKSKYVPPLVEAVPQSRQKKQKISRRDVMFMDNIFEDADSTPVLMYRKISQKRLRPLEPSYYHPSLANIGKKLEPSNIRSKKYSINRMKSKYVPPLVEAVPRSRQKKQKSGRRTPNRAPKKEIRQPAAPQEQPTGFGEPPIEYKSENKSRQKIPALDSYDPKTYPHKNPQIKSGKQDKNTLAATTVMQSLNNHSGDGVDVTFPYSKLFFARPALIKPQLQDKEHSFGLNSLVPSSNHIQNVMPSNNIQRQKKVYTRGYQKMALNNPWKPLGTGEVVVGGQYAEPPARVVTRFQPSAPVFLEDSDSFNPSGVSGLFDNTEYSQISPYVNYKDSNLAFSPQNVNDAFSIVYKRR